jgi:cytochrome oxidase Cu insertion factor (SCO1/SenC/PrrC family)
MKECFIISLYVVFGISWSMRNLIYFQSLLFSKIKNQCTQVKDVPSVCKFSIGGLFNIVNHEGKHVTDHDFIEKWTPIYFVSTHYTDICVDGI